MSAPETGRIPERLLLGAGPSVVPQVVLDALAQPTIGHLDPAFVAVMEETCDRLRVAFRTANAASFPVSATGSGGMEACVTNLAVPGSRVICGVNGAFGERLYDALTRHGAEVVRVEGEWGRALPLERLHEAAGEGFDAMILVHGETSTGVVQQLDGLAELCREHDALLILDCVTSLGGQPLNVDAAGVDAAFSGTQKCLNCPPGLAPMTMNERAVARLDRSNRSWYFDLSLVLRYWSDGGSGRTYHHTAPVNLIYALRTALAVVEQEGVEQRWERHARAHRAMALALGELGLVRLAPAGEQLNPLLAVRVPLGIDEFAVRRNLLVEDGIEVSGGLGPLAGQIWRIGIMGEGARLEPQRRLVEGLAKRLGRSSVDAVAALRQEHPDQRGAPSASSASLRASRDETGSSRSGRSHAM